MKKNLTELVFIIDRSGSMGGLESDTIGGFNSLIAKQKKQEGEAIVTTVLFDDRYELLHDRFSIESVSPMTESQYYVRGCTALLDAVGSTISKIGNVQKNLPEEDRAEKVIFCIITDGYENASCEYSLSDVKRMISRQQEKHGWEFLFMGANMDAVSEAGRLGIRKDRAVTYFNDSAGLGASYEAMECAVGELRSARHMRSVGSRWKKAVEEDIKNRGDR